MQSGGLLLAAVLLPFLGAALAAFIPKKLLPLLTLIPAAIFTWIALVPAEQIPAIQIPWIPDLGLGFDLRLDGLSLAFGSLISLVGAGVFLYSSEYLQTDPRRGRFFAVLSAFTGAMLGIVCSDNLLGLVIFWELTSITSFLLIGFDSEKAESRRAAIQAFIITSAGGLSLLAGAVMLGSVAETYRISELGSQIDVILSSPLYPVIVLCIFGGAFTKSAQIPFYFWLPNAMNAPTPVSAFLHSATMVQAGVYLTARLSPILGGPAWSEALTIMGGITAILGAVLVLFQTDLKRLLAYSTVAALGVLIATIGQGNSDAFLAFFLAHGLYKGGMFLVAGMISHGAHTLDSRELRGLWKSMPRTGAIGHALAASMAAVPLMFGFAAKELLLHSSAPFYIVAVMAYGSAAVVVAYAVGIRPFWGKPSVEAHDPGIRMMLGPALNAVLGFVFGYGAAYLASRFTYSLAAQASERLPWTAGVVVGVPLLLSTISLAVGVGLCYGWLWLTRRDWAKAPSVDRVYDLSMQGFRFGSAQVTQIFQHGNLNGYIRTIVIGLVALVWIALLDWGKVLAPLLQEHELSLLEGAVGTAIIVGALVAVLARSRLAAIATLGIVGYGVALVYVMFGAPDLAMTQIAVETLTLILFVFTFYYLPKKPQRPNTTVRTADAILAAAFGATLTFMAIAATHMNPTPVLREFFADQSYTEAHGRNIVNVILVDFRGIDTMGEITVLAVAAMGVFSLLRIGRRKQPSDQ